METTSKKFIIAVDGPAGTGKSSVCKAVSEELGWGYFNTGAIYRGVALVGKFLSLDLADCEQAVRAAKHYRDEAEWDLAGRILKYKGTDLVSEISNNDTAQNASFVAKNTAVRELLLPVQIEKVQTSKFSGVVVEGRDIGTVVFPDADLKIFLTANLKTRTRRRQNQLKSESANLKATNYENLAKTLSKRDLQDSQRATAPLAKAHDAVEVDTSNLSLEEVKERIIGMIR